MRALRLFGMLTLYYAAIAALVAAALTLAPGLESYLPIGGAQALISTPPLGLEQLSEAPQVTRVDSLGSSLAWMAITLLAALLTSLPVSWVYMSVRDHEAYDQSLVDTVVVLPIIVTSVVIIVQHSLALAFSLAGIAAAVRFRNSLKSTGDALFILLAVGIGLSAGIGAVELAALMSVAFNYCFLALWASGYGARQGMKRYLDDCAPAGDPAPTPPAQAPGEPSGGRS
jgi:hypothetical protein